MSQAPSQVGLERWYQAYIADTRTKAELEELVSEADGDVLDTEFIQIRIKSLESSTVVNGDFCTFCRSMLEKWPDAADLDVYEWWHPGTSYIEKPWLQHTNGRWRPNVYEYPENQDIYRSVVMDAVPNTLQMEASMNRGCKFCAYMLYVIEDFQVPDQGFRVLHTFRKIERRLDLLGRSLESTLSVLQSKRRSSEDLSLGLPGRDGPPEGEILDWVEFVSRRIEGATRACNNEINTLDFARGLLSKCLQEHGLCNQMYSSILPTRLIAVHTFPIRLIKTTLLDAPPKYATLSHSWGKTGCLKLRKTNEAALLEELPSSDLGQCYRDAVMIAQQMGIEYLWIDSLCIVQDDEEDWEKEAATMGAIYSNSHLNIAASDVLDGECAIMTKRKHYRDQVEATVLYRARPCVLRFEKFALYNRHVRMPHLATRAWALQEKILSPRTIHLGNRGGFWECKEHLASETGNGGDEKTSAHVALVFRKPEDRHALERYASDRSVATHTRSTYVMERWWDDIIQLYSNAQLSVNKDKLPALSGIARAYHEQTGDRYLAGLWESHLIRQLCWRVPKAPHLEEQARPVWRAPSWSWMSIDGPVDPTIDAWWTGRRDIDYVRVEDAVISVSGIDPFGQIKDGRLRLSCTNLFVGQVDWSKSTFLLRRPDTDRTSYAGLPCPFTRDCRDSMLDGQVSLGYLLPVRKLVHWVKLIEGLILTPSGKASGEYLRVGLFDFGVWEDGAGNTEKEWMYATLSRLTAGPTRPGLDAVCPNTMKNDSGGSKRFQIEII